MDRSPLTREQRNGYITKLLKMIWIDETTLTDFEYIHLCSALAEIDRDRQSARVVNG